MCGQGHLQITVICFQLLEHRRWPTNLTSEVLAHAAIPDLPGSIADTVNSSDDFFQAATPSHSSLALWFVSATDFLNGSGFNLPQPLQPSSPSVATLNGGIFLSSARMTRLNSLSCRMLFQDQNLRLGQLSWVCSNSQGFAISVNRSIHE